MNSSVIPCSAQKMSTVVACKFEDGVIIGADSQITSGEYISNRTANKLIKIDSLIYASGSGSEANIQFIIDKARYQLQGIKLNIKEVLVVAAASIFRELCYQYRNTADVEFLLVGWDKVNAGQVYSISSGGMMTIESVCAIGSGSVYSHGYLDACYTANMNKEEAKGLVVKTIKLAILRDNMSDGYINVVVLTNSGIEIGCCA